MDRLPLEILLLIFQELDEIKSFVLLSKRYKDCVTTHWIYCNIATRFPVRQHLFQAVGRACHVDTIKRFLQADPRCLTLELVRCLHHRYTNVDAGLRRYGGGEYVHEGWGTRRTGISPSAFACLLAAGRQCGWTDAEMTQTQSQSSVFSAWESMKVAEEGITVGTHLSVDHIVQLRLMPEEARQEDWDRLETALKRRCVGLFSEDPVFSTDKLARAVILEPRLIPLFKNVGWSYNAEANDALVRSILLVSLDSTATMDPDRWECFLKDGSRGRDNRHSIVYRQLKDYIVRSNGMCYVSATVASEVMVVDVDHNEKHSQNMTWAQVAYTALPVLMDLARDGLLDFTINDLSDGLTQLQQGTNQIFTPFSRGGVLSALLDLGDDYERSDPSGGFRQVIANLTAYERCGMLSRDRGTRFLKCDRTLAVEAAVEKMIRIPTKGATLLSLVTTYPSLVGTIEKTIRRHAISLDALPPLSTNPRQSSSPLFSHFPKFLSPIAFDYQGARARYPLGLGVDPWVEDYYVVPADFPPSAASFIWPPRPREHYKIIPAVEPTPDQPGIPEQRLSRGYVTGHGLRKDLKTTVGVVLKDHMIPGIPVVLFQYAAEKVEAPLAEWAYDRLPQQSLPLAIALLDLFDKESEVLDIVLMHALLNVNVSIAYFYLLLGVPLRPHHTEAIERLSIPKMKCYEDHLRLGYTKKLGWRPNKRFLAAKRRKNNKDLSLQSRRLKAGVTLK